MTFPKKLSNLTASDIKFFMKVNRGFFEAVIGALVTGIGTAWMVDGIYRDGALTELVKMQLSFLDGKATLDKDGNIKLL